MEHIYNELSARARALFSFSENFKLIDFFWNVKSNQNVILLKGDH